MIFSLMDWVALVDHARAKIGDDFADALEREALGPAPDARPEELREMLDQAICAKAGIEDLQSALEDAVYGKK